MEHLIAVDKMFAGSFLLATVAATSFLIYVTYTLKYERDMQAIFNCIISRSHLIGFILLLSIPTGYFYMRDMYLSAGSVIILKTLSSAGFYCLSRRARSILRMRNYIR